MAELYRETEQEERQESPMMYIAYTLKVLFAWVVAMILCLWLLWTASHVLLLLLGAATIAATLHPLVWGKEKWHWLIGGLVAIGFWIVVAVLLGGLGWLLRDPIMHEIHQWPQIKTSLHHAMVNVANFANLPSPPSVDDMLDQAVEYVVGEHKTSMLTAVAGGAGAVGVALALLVFGSIFLLIEQPTTLIEPISSRLPPSHGASLHATMRDLGYKLRHWLTGTGAAIVIVGVFTGAGLWVGGVRFALPLGVVTGVAEIVPTVGPIISAVVALLLALSQGTQQVVTVLIVYILLHLIESYIMIPLIMKQAVRIPPFISLFTIVLWARLLGPLGLLLALPLDLTIWSVFSHFVGRHSPQTPPAQTGPKEE